MNQWVLAAGAEEAPKRPPLCARCELRHRERPRLAMGLVLVGEQYHIFPLMFLKGKKLRWRLAGRALCGVRRPYRFKARLATGRPKPSPHDYRLVGFSLAQRLPPPGRWRQPGALRFVRILAPSQNRSGGSRGTLALE